MNTRCDGCGYSLDPARNLINDAPDGRVLCDGCNEEGTTTRPVPTPIQGFIDQLASRGGGERYEGHQPEAVRQNVRGWAARLGQRIETAGGETWAYAVRTPLAEYVVREIARDGHLYVSRFRRPVEQGALV